MSENILEINNLSKYFGGLAAVSECSLKVKKGTITGIIGPNGSGKTTLFNLIAGNLKSSAGSVMFNNENITDIPSHTAQFFPTPVFHPISDWRYDGTRWSETSIWFTNLAVLLTVWAAVIIIERRKKASNEISLV